MKTYALFNVCVLLYVGLMRDNCSDIVDYQLFIIKEIFFENFLCFLVNLLKNVVILHPEKGSKCCLIYK